jgi:ankyrin repeat protein
MNLSMSSVILFGQKRCFGKLQKLVENRISQLLLQRGAGADARDLAGRSPLSFDVESDCLAAVTLLLDAGANINSTCKSGRTRLTYATEAGNLWVIHLDNEANRTIRD